MLLAEQPVHQRFVRPGPLVLGSTLLKSPTPTADRDRTVSRRSEPRSRTALMGEQPNPWDQLQPQDATIRHRALFHRSRWRRLYLHPARARSPGEGPAYDGGHRFARRRRTATCHLTVPNNRNGSVVTGSLRKFVAKLVEHVGFGEITKARHAYRRYSNAPIRLVAV